MTAWYVIQSGKNLTFESGEVDLDSSKCIPSAMSTGPAKQSLLPTRVAYSFKRNEGLSR